MITREEVQNKAVRLSRENKILLLEWATGLGKSKAAIKIMKDMKEEGKPLKVLLVVAETAHKSNWGEEFDKWLDRGGISITICCYASFKAYEGEYYDLIIFDEAHHLASEFRQSILYTLEYKRILLLTATISSIIKFDLLAILGSMEVYSIPLSVAIENKIIPEPKVIFINLELENTVRNEKIVIKRGKGTEHYICQYPDRLKYLAKAKDKKCNMTLTIQCTQKEKHEYLVSQIEFYKRMCILNNNAIWANTKWMNLCSERKRTLGEFKTKHLKMLLDMLNLDSKRFICFCGSVAQSRSLGALKCIDSKKTNNKELIDAFNKKEIDALFAVGMLQEGQNLNDIEVGIITQLDGNARGVIQKIGRVIRGKEPLIYVLYYEGTQDEVYKNRAVSLIGKEYVQEINGIDYGTKIIL